MRNTGGGTIRRTEEVGDFAVQDTHVQRSSSMSFALRWKHENLRLITSVSVFSLISLLLFLFMLYGTSGKNVTLVVNGHETPVHTNQWNVQRLLKEQAITLGDHDRVSHSLDSRIEDGETIVVDHAIPVEVTADGETRTMYTIGKNVGSALEDLNIDLAPDDKVTPSLDSPLAEGSKLQIVRVEKKQEAVSEPIAYDVVQKEDPELPKGKQQVVQEGKEGVLLKKIEKVYEDGQLVSEKVVDQDVQTESVNKIVAIGTKNPVAALSVPDEVTKSGVTFGAKKVLKNVTLTAYSANASSTGKSSSDPGYGVTASGTRVTEGRTIAVDPSVIPLGWWVYIDGLGFRRAEDTGSAIKGNKIDVYFDSESNANRFGTKRGYTVYVIGPKKPSAD
jgi:uncharacterized protein YabE (DUF348 family)